MVGWSTGQPRLWVLVAHRWLVRHRRIHQPLPPNSETDIPWIIPRAPLRHCVDLIIIITIIPPPLSLLPPALLPFPLLLLGLSPLIPPCAHASTTQRPVATANGPASLASATLPLQKGAMIYDWDWKAEVSIRLLFFCFSSSPADQLHPVTKARVTKL
jgi:hypothetical protein